MPTMWQPFPGEDEVDLMSEWVVIDEGASVVCPGCATPRDKRLEAGGLER
jgi:hypothetical protein